MFAWIDSDILRYHRSNRMLRGVFTVFVFVRVCECINRIALGACRPTSIEYNL